MKIACSISTSPQDLASHFKKAPGFVSAEVSASGNGRSRGYGLVEFSSSAAASKAIDAFNESTIGERKVFVRLDRGANVRTDEDDKQRRPAGTRRPNPSRSNIAPLRVRPEDEGRLIYVGNIPWRSSWQDIKDFFKEIGPVIRVDIPLNKATRRSRGFATVLFEKPEDAIAAIQKFNESEMGGRTITVRLDQFVGGARDEE
jgi:RNA recognition motif-containing protein